MEESNNTFEFFDVKGIKSGEGFNAKAREDVKRKEKIDEEKRKAYSTIIIAVKKRMKEERIFIEDEEAIGEIIRKIFEKYPNVFEKVTKARSDVLDDDFIDYNGMIAEIIGFVISSERQAKIDDDNIR